MGDLVCLDDVDPFAAETEDELEILWQDLYHRLLEDYGSNPDDPDRGCGLANALNAPFDPNVGRTIEADFRKDDRVLGVQATVAEGSVSGDWNVDIQVVATAGTIAANVTVDGQGFEIRRVA